MNKTVIEMAQEAGFNPHDMSDDFTCNLINIKRFAELVRADEREKFCSVLRQLHDSYSLQSRTTGIVENKMRAT